MPTILIVDHGHAASATLIQRLREAGYSTLCISGVLEAMELVRRAKIDLIVLELLLLRVGGLDVLRGLRAQNLTVPVVVYTVLDSPSMFAEARTLGARDCFHKDQVTVDELLDYIRAALPLSPPGT